MNAGTNLTSKYFSWDLYKGKFEETDQLPFMASPGPILTVVAVYLIFVLKIGPVFMRKREAYKLTNTMLIYNFGQVIISVYLGCRFFTDLVTTGVFPRRCYINSTYERDRFVVSLYMYLSAKTIELLDTVFFVLRKKNNQVTFLHLYHYTIMVLSTWCLLKYWPSHTLLFIGFLNSLVHVFMYTYYGLAALGPNVAKYLTWKKYMTKFQLIQFVAIIIQYLMTLRVSECPPEKGVAVFVSCNTAVILLLFMNFYRQNYKKKKTLKLLNESIPALCVPKMTRVT